MDPALTETQAASSPPAELPDLGDIVSRSYLSLDWLVILERLANHCASARGVAAARTLTLAKDLQDCRALYALVAEVGALMDAREEAPAVSVSDIAPLVERAGRGLVLDARELIEVGRTLRALHDLRRWVDPRRAKVPGLAILLEPIQVDPELLGRLEQSFEPDGELSSAAWPSLRNLRQSVRSLRDRIRTTLDDMLHNESFAEILQDRFITEREGRFVLPVKVGRRSGVGIVHDTSQSGETVFVEPGAIVEPQNELKELVASLRREEQRILAELSLRVGRYRETLAQALDAAAHFDLTVARARLGRELGGSIPALGDQGILSLIDARHPVLVLRGVQVVPNRLHLDSARPALVLTGPNTGGKTVALKTLGLAALFVRSGIPFPAHPDSRVDFFEPVLADIGDLQSVEGDLSTFSGHLLVLQRFLQAAAPGALLLLDEIAVGTEPHQGAALARAVMEELIEAGARVAVTTHYSELKSLSLQDPRFSTSGVSLVNGRPTWRFEEGLIGQSHALSVARRLGLPPGLLERARGLLGEGERMIADLSDRLEREIDAARRSAHDAEERGFRAQELQGWEARLGQKERDLQREFRQTLERRLRDREREVKALIAALQADPGLARAGRTLEEIRQIRETIEEPELHPQGSPIGEIMPGEQVFVPSLGRRGRVLEIAAGGRVLLELGGMTTWLRTQELRADQDAERPVTRAKGKDKEKRTELTDRRSPERFGGLPCEGNRIDLRGMRVEESIEAVELFLDRLVQRNEPVAFILHGHGTGALKKAIREWLPRFPLAQRWRPGEEGEGGDAYTLVDLG